MKPIQRNSSLNKAKIHADPFLSSAMLPDAQGERSNTVVETCDVGNAPPVIAKDAVEVLAESLCLLEQTQELLT